MYNVTPTTNGIFFYIEIKKNQIVSPTIMGSSRADFAQCQQVK